MQPDAQKVVDRVNHEERDSMSKSDDWQTPPHLMAVLDKVFRFNLEVCAAKDNRALVGAPYIGLDTGTNALEVPWASSGCQPRAYCNPPYSQLPAFITAARDNAVHTPMVVVMLIPAYTDTLVWHNVIDKAAVEVRFLKGRLAFLMNGQRQTTARFPSAVVVFDGGSATVGRTPKYWLWDWKREG
jgi:site-specific DNA-methyltransferase (adenine-specific)